MSGNLDRIRIRVGISRCLLGDEVRFDGGHKKDGFITGTLGKFFEWVTVCPELEVGMGVPRESVRLVGVPGKIQMLGVRSGKDWTAQMHSYSENKVHELAEPELHGFILKKDSPSCGMERVRIYSTGGPAQKQGSGMFAEALMRRFPLLPVEEEGRLHDLPLRENFIERVFAHFRWTAFLKTAPRARDLVDFHTRNKLAILAHDRITYQKLGQLVASSGGIGLARKLQDYGELYMHALRMRATSRKHANVLYHLMGYLKTNLDGADKTELADCIEEYRQERIPLVVPITLLLHHFRKNPVQWVLDQTYLKPYPAELMLRNHV